MSSAPLYGAAFANKPSIWTAANEPVEEKPGGFKGNGDGKDGDGQQVAVVTASPSDGGVIQSVGDAGEAVVEYAEDRGEQFGHQAYKEVVMPLGLGVMSPVAGAAAMVGGVAAGAGAFVTGIAFGAISTLRGVVGVVPLAIDWVVRPVADGMAFVVDEVDDSIQGTLALTDPVLADAVEETKDDNIGDIRTHALDDIIGEGGDGADAKGDGTNSKENSGQRKLTPAQSIREAPYSTYIIEAPYSIRKAPYSIQAPCSIREAPEWSVKPIPLVRTGEILRSSYKGSAGLLPSTKKDIIMSRSLEPSYRVLANEPAYYEPVTQFQKSEVPVGYVVEEPPVIVEPVEFINSYGNVNTYGSPISFPIAPPSPVALLETRPGHQSPVGTTKIVPPTNDRYPIPTRSGNLIATLD